MKKTDLFDQLDNVFGNYAEGKATESDLIDVAFKLREYLHRYPHPHDLVNSREPLKFVEPEVLGLMVRAFKTGWNERGRTSAFFEPSDDFPVRSVKPFLDKLKLHKYENQ